MTTLRSIYHRTRPLMARLGPKNPLMRLWASFILDRLCRELGTRVAFVGDAMEITKGRQVMRLSQNHWIYALGISKDFDSYFNTVESRREGEREVVDYSRPALQKFRASGLEFEVSGFPEEEKAILDYFRWYRPQPGETVFDVGANCGLSAYYFSQCVGPQGKIYALEPDPLNYAVLLRNIERHQLKNVIPVRKAVAARKATMQFFSEGTIGSSLAHQTNRPTVGTVENVEAIRLEDACEEYGMPSFVKVDVEGAEVEVFDAARDFLRKCSIQFAVDTNHYKNGVRTQHDVERIFQACGYEVLSSAECGFMTTWARRSA